jgi:ribonucleotide reductase beta subunit family protein with ferritin-like domain
VAENICRLYIRLITRIYSKLKKQNSSKINEPIKKWAAELNRTFERKKFKWPKNTLKNAHHLWP